MKRILLNKISFPFFVLIFLFGLPLMGQNVYVVNTTDDLDDGVCDGVHCSFREALNASNNDGVASNIHFDIPGNGVHVLTSYGSFWAVRDSSTTIIDGTTQPGNDPMQGLIKLENSPGLFFPLIEVYNSNTLIKGIHFVGNNDGAIINSTSDNLTLKHNYFTSPNSFVFSGLGNQSPNNLHLESNYFYDLKSIVIDVENNNNNGRFENAMVLNNYFGLTPNNSIAPVQEGVNKISGYYKGNEFHHGTYGIREVSFTQIQQNLFFCNTIPLGGTKNKEVPIIGTISATTISGGATSNDTIELYQVIDNDCTGAVCQGGKYLGVAVTNENGQWSFPTPVDLNINDKVIAVAYGHYGSTSGFSNCKTYQLRSNFPITYTVNTTDDNNDGTCDSIHCSLREAIHASNNDVSPSNIHFNIAGLPPFLIEFNTNLFTFDSLNIIDDGTTIDGTTQPGNNPMRGLIQIQNPNNITFNIIGANTTIKGIHFRDNIANDQLRIFADNSLITTNYFTNDANMVFAETPRATAVTIEHNYFYNMEEIMHPSTNFRTYSNVQFLNNIVGLNPNNEIAPVVNGLRIYGQDNILIKGNQFHHGDFGIRNISSKLSENLFFCNDQPLTNVINTKNPIVGSMTTDFIAGGATKGDTIEMYKVIDTDCPVPICQGGAYLGKTITNNNGTWFFPIPPTLAIGDKITFFAYDKYNSSNFTACVDYQPTVITYDTVFYIVNTTDDIDDGICNEIHCSLREAIHASNTDANPSIIDFNISGEGPFLITLNNNLTSSDSLAIIEHNTTIDGTTQLGNNPMKGLIQIQNPSNLIFDIIGANTTIKGLNFRPNPNFSALNFSTHNTLISTNYFTNPGRTAFVFPERATATTIENNYFYDLNSIFEGSLNFNALDGTSFLNNIVGLSPTGIISPVVSGLELPGNNMTVIGNEFHNSEFGLGITGSSSLAKSNLFFCNEFGFSAGGSAIPAPTITVISIDSIYGIGTAGDSIEIYQVTDSLCPDIQCQGGKLLGTVLVKPGGYWDLPYPSTLNLFDRVVALAFNSQGQTSNFSTCKIVLPTDCGLAEPMVMNESPCSGVGTILDLDQMNPFGFGGTFPSTECEITFKGNEAWLSVEVPSSGNFLVRTNVANTVVPAIEIYTECRTTPLPECAILDTVPYVLFFENYTPGDILYLRVWDKDNEVVDDEVVPAFLHLTAHALDLDKSKWEICDYEDLISDNPTNLVRREAATFILDYEPNTPQSEIDQNTAELIEEGLELQKECYCGHAPIQLWGTDNPIDLDDRRRRAAKRRAAVDTTNYNYIFETVEFQVNSYAIGQQHDTDITMDAEGNFVMVWKDEQRRHNYGRVYLSSGNPVSVEFQIGSSDKTQFASSVAMLPNRDFMVVWHEINPVEPSSRALVFGRLFDVNGLPKGAAFNISTPAAATASTSALREIAQYGTNPQISVAANGNFVVVWHVDRNIFAQRFNKSGEMIGELIEVETSFESNYASSPAIALNDAGAFIITWTGRDTVETGIYGQRFANDGTKIDSSFLVNTTQTKEQTRADVILKNDGGFIVAWESFEQLNDTSSYDIYGQLFAADATKIGGEFLINDYTYFAQSRPSLALFDNGNFLVAWNSDEQDGFAEGIYAKLFDANGNPIPPSFDDSDKGSFGEEFRMNTYNDPQQRKPKTATNGGTIFMGAWEDGANDGSFEGIFAQRYENVLVNDNNIFYPIGTATPSTLLGDELTYPTSIYSPSATTDKVAKVAILDTGIDHEHALIQNAIWNNPETNDGDNCLFDDEIGYDFINDIGTPLDLDGHGTQINGMITRNFDRNVKLELMNLKFHELDRGSVFDAICGIYYSVDNGAGVLNLSWGFEAPEEPVVLKKALQYAADHDVLIVTTAGNTSKNNDRINKYPANLDVPNMIVVTAYEYKEQTGEIKLANYASHGQNNVDIAAYGFVETAQRGGAKTLSAGTSLAAPSVARTAATIKGLYPDLTATEIKDCILSTAAQVANLSDKVATGGILDHDAALDCAYDKVISSSCRSNLFLDKITLDSKTYQSNDSLKSTATIERDSVVIFTANNLISLLEGFHAKAGSEFTAKIEACTTSFDAEAITQSLQITATSMDEEQLLNATVYPNPVIDKVHVKVQKSTLGFNAAVFDMMGKQVFFQQNTNNQATLDVSHLTAGIYFINIDNQLTQKLIIDEN